MVPRKGSHLSQTQKKMTGKLFMAIQWSWLNVLVSAVSMLALFSQQKTGALAHRSVDLSRTNDRQLRSELLQKAIPRSEYDNLRGEPSPLNIEKSIRQLNEDNKNGDDYFVSEDYMYSLSGYSLKYATCQPLQQFSDSAAKAGEYSPMITDDVVILRLCPSKTCSNYIQYGCHYNFAEYVIGMKDFIRIMLRYSTDRRDKMCEYCSKCGYGGNGGDRFLDEGNNNNNNNNQNQNQNQGENNNNNNGDNKNNNNQEQNKDGDNNKNENNNNNNGDNNNNQNNNNNNENKNEDNNKNENNENKNEGNNENKEENNNKEDNQNNENKEDNGEKQNQSGNDEGSVSEADSSSYSNDPCDAKATYCYNFDKDCGGANDDKYLDYMDYMDYLNCAKVDDKNNNRYYVRPRCDATQGTIKMAVYRDPYCSMYAGNDVSVKNLGLGFRDGIFENFYDSRCISCAETSNPPDFGADENLCNRMHHDSAKCTSNLAYQVFDDHVDDTTECSFIESVRFGTYDSSGQFATDSMSKVKQTVTRGQLIALGVSVVVCVILAIYACYLHHAMTNLLIYSLSHSHLLPPSRHRSRQSRGRTRQRDYEDDWDQMGGKIPALS